MNDWSQGVPFNFCGVFNHWHYYYCEATQRLKAVHAVTLKELADTAYRKPPPLIRQEVHSGYEQMGS